MQGARAKFLCEISHARDLINSILRVFKQKYEKLGLCNSPGVSITKLDWITKIFRFYVAFFIFRNVGVIILELFGARIFAILIGNRPWNFPTLFKVFWKLLKIRDE